MVGTRGIVVAAAGGLREGVVGVIYLLEFLGAGGAFGGVGGDAVGVGFQCLSGVRMGMSGGVHGRVQEVGNRCCLEGAG